MAGFPVSNSVYVTDLDKCDPVLSGQHSQHIPPVPAYNVVQPFNAAAYPGPPPSLCNDPQGILPGEVPPHQSTLPNYNAPLIQTTTLQIPGNYQSATSSTGQVLNEPVVQTMTAPEANPNDPSTNEKSVHISCPFCHLEITTSTEYVSGSSTYLCFFILALTRCICLSWLPFVTTSTKDVIHRCPSCGAECGRFKRQQYRQNFGRYGHIGSKNNHGFAWNKNKKSNRSNIGTHGLTGIGSHRHTGFGNAGFHAHRHTGVGMHGRSTLGSHKKTGFSKPISHSHSKRKGRR